MKQSSDKQTGHRLAAFFERNENTLFIFSLLFCAVMCVLLFDVKLSLSGDDSDYLISAENFWRHFAYPGGHAPLYPMLLSPLAGIFGMKLLLFKSLSALFIVLSFWLLYKSFRGVVPSLILMPALLLASVCSYIFFYAGYTYSEPLFMLLQSVFVYFFSKYFLTTGQDASYGLKDGWRKYLVIAAIALCLALARSIGYAVIGAVVIFLLTQRRWKDVLYFNAAFVLVFAAFQILKSLAWPGSGEAYGITRLFSIDPYNPSLGTENFAGIMKRFVENSNIYLSFFLYQFMGFVKETPPEYVLDSPVRTVVTYLLYGLCLAAVFKRNRALLFIGLYAGVMNFTSFVALQSLWAQDRLIMVYYPLMLIFLLGGICYLLRIKALRKGFLLYPLLLVVIACGTLNTTAKKVARNLPVLQQNLLGDNLYGLTPDWRNFIKGSEWAARNLPKDAIIVSRKPSISKVYTGRDFIVTPTTLPFPPEKIMGLKNNRPKGFAFVVSDAAKGVFPGEGVKYLASHIRGEKFSLDGTAATLVCLYFLPDEEVGGLIEALGANRIPYTLDFDGFIDRLAAIESYRFYDPEDMRRYLLENKIEYLLLPQLRAYPSRKTDQYINDVHRYREFISLRYPGSFRIVHSIGDDEPCEIAEFIR
ncbi:MAG: hypothetical protein LBJ58_05150 [Tannerellaceae bacterium]|jgi:hypothetical protein|nr:hypothetical protein [Tannerellaceae bacterium]